MKSFSKCGTLMMTMLVVTFVGLGTLFTGSAADCPLSLTETEACANTIVPFLLEVYKEQMENLLEEVKDYVFSLPLSKSEVKNAGPNCEAAQLELIALSFQVGYLSHLPEWFHYPVRQLQTYLWLTDLLRPLYETCKQKVFSCRCEYYCVTKRGTPLSKKAMKDMMPPEDLKRNLTLVLKQLPPGSQFLLAFPIDAVDMYYNLPMVECLIWRDNGIWSAAMELPRSIDWDLYFSETGGRVVAHHQRFKKMLLFDEEESAGCIKYDLCKLPTRESAFLGEKQRKCVIKALKNDKDFFPACMKRGAS